MKSIAIVQSSYIPWKGYFDLIRSVDEFVLLDDVQFTRRDWRNRNVIKTADGPRWLTIPVISKGRYEQTIEETRIAAPWAEKHWTALRINYAKAPCFRELAPALKELYDAASRESLLSRVNHVMITGVCALLGIATTIRWSREYSPSGSKSDRLLSICRAAGATKYLSGPSAASYIERDKFSAAGVTVAYADYSGYPQYRQLYGDFSHGLSILDLLFNEGLEALTYMRVFEL